MDGIEVPCMHRGIQYSVVPIGRRQVGESSRQISSSNRYHEKFTRHYTWTPNIEPALGSTLRRGPYRLDAIYYVTSLRKPSPIWT